MLFCVCLLFISMFASDSWLLSAMLARNSSPSFSFSRTILAWNIIDIIIIQPWSNSNIQKCNKLSQKCVHLVSPLLATPAFFAQLPLAPIPYCTEPHMPPKLCSFGVGQLTTYIKVYHPKQTIHIIHTPGKPYHHRQLLTWASRNSSTSCLSLSRACSMSANIFFGKTPFHLFQFLPRCDFLHQQLTLLYRNIARPERFLIPTLLCISTSHLYWWNFYQI